MPDPLPTLTKYYSSSSLPMFSWWPIDLHYFSLMFVEISKRLTIKFLLPQGSWTTQHLTHAWAKVLCGSYLDTAKHDIARRSPLLTLNKNLLSTWIPGCRCSMRTICLFLFHVCWNIRETNNKVPSTIGFPNNNIFDMFYFFPLLETIFRDSILQVSYWFTLCIRGHLTILPR